MENLQSLLYAIASISASFVAILGGFVASKFHTVSGERESLKNQLSKINCDIVLKKAQKGILYDQLNIDDALDYIDEHIDDLLNHSALKEVYLETEKELLGYDLLLPYWNRALDLLVKIEGVNEDTITFNEDYVPNSVVLDVKDNHFDYKACAIITKQLFPHPFYSAKTISNSTDNWYEHTSQKFEDLEHEIYALSIQKSLLEEQEKALLKPNGMISGLIVFISFSILNIICPLILSTIEFSDACSKYIGWISIGVLALGLTTVFCYLISLLKWKEKEEPDSKSE